MIPERLQKVFEDVFSIKFPVNESTVRNDIPEWDSINHLNLVVELEEVFKVSFTAEEIQALDSVAAILNKVGLKQDRNS